MPKTQTSIKNEVYFKIAHIDDFYLINKIERELKLQLTTLREMNLILNNNFSFLWKILLKKELIGFIQLNGDAIESEIIGMGIKKKFQRLGVGKKAIKFLINKGFKNIFLEVSEKNYKALNFYLFMGFKMIEIRHDYYKINKEIPEDAIILNLKKI